MSLRAIPGWQTVLADLALILFVSSAAALSQDDLAPGETDAGPKAQQSWDFADAAPTPSAIYAAGPDMPRLADWIAATPRDPRERLTITATYAPGQRQAVWAEVDALYREAEEAGFPATINLAPGSESKVGARFAFDGEPANGT